MAGMSDDLENKILDHILRGTPYTAPSTLYVALFTVDPDDTGGGTEVSGGAYARVAVDPTLSSGDWVGTSAGSATAVSAGTDGTVSNAKIITFPAPSGANWGVITGFAIMDAITGGNVMFYTALNSSKTVNDGDDAPSFAIGALTVQIDN